MRGMKLSFKCKTNLKNLKKLTIKALRQCSLNIRDVYNLKLIYKKIYSKSSQSTFMSSSTAPESTTTLAKNGNNSFKVWLIIHLRTVKSNLLKNYSLRSRTRLSNRKNYTSRIYPAQSPQELIRIIIIIYNLQVNKKLKSWSRCCKTKIWKSTN